MTPLRKFLQGPLSDEEYGKLKADFIGLLFVLAVGVILVIIAGVCSWMN